MGKKGLLSSMELKIRDIPKTYTFTIYALKVFWKEFINIRTQKPHTQDHQQSSSPSPFKFISANTCPVESTDTHLQRICTFSSCSASLLVHSLNPLHKIKLD
jgi:hypothetical protein